MSPLLYQNHAPSMLNCVQACLVGGRGEAQPGLSRTAHPLERGGDLGGGVRFPGGSPWAWEDSKPHKWELAFVS